MTGLVRIINYSDESPRYGWRQTPPRNRGNLSKIESADGGFDGGAHCVQLTCQTTVKTIGRVLRDGRRWFSHVAPMNGLVHEIVGQTAAKLHHRYQGFAGTGIVVVAGHLLELGGQVPCLGQQHSGLAMGHAKRRLFGGQNLRRVFVRGASQTAVRFLVRGQKSCIRAAT